MEAIASAKYLRGSAQKARLVVDMIRGKDINQALAILRFSSKRASGLIEKCVRSAIANANEAAERAKPRDRTSWPRIVSSVTPGSSTVGQPRIDVAFVRLRRVEPIASSGTSATSP